MTANLVNADIDDLLDSGNQWAAGVRDRFRNLASEQAAFVRHLYSRHELWNMVAIRNSTWNEDTRAYLEQESWARELVRMAVAQIADTGSTPAVRPCR